MASVSRRIKHEVKQPKGGYLPPKLLKVDVLGAGLGEVDHTIENLHPSLVGIVVDYLTRTAGGTEPRDAFRVSLKGAAKLGFSVFADAAAMVDRLAPGYLDDDAVVVGCMLAGYDVAYRQSVDYYRPDAATTPDEKTIAHIRTMVIRGLQFFDKYGPVMRDGFTFEGGYTNLIDSGDGDFLTADTLWDFKVSVAAPTNVNTLQLLVYFLMGKRSVHPEFQSLTHVGVFNPRLNSAYRFRVDDLSAEALAVISRDVIGYG